MNKLLTTITSMAAFSFLTTTSQATVFWDFVQKGNNVTATASGSFDNAVGSSKNFADGTSSAHYGLATIGVIDSGSLNYFKNNVGRQTPLSPTSAPPLTADSSIGGFGYVEGSIFWSRTLNGDSLDAGESVSGSMTFNGKSLADFAISPSNAGAVLWQMNGTTNVGNAIVLKVNGAVTVPEPSSSALLGLGTLCLLARRKR